MNVIFTCGGTGGHINPAIAVANIWQERHPDSRILFIGGTGEMEEELVPKAGFRLETMPISGFSRKRNLKALQSNARAAGLVVSGIRKCKKLIRDFEADVVVGTGGYSSFPALMAASLLGIPTCVHESNAMPGLTTRVIAGRVDRVMVSFPESARFYRDPGKVRVVGMPVRRDFIYTKKEDARRELGITDDRPLILSAFGSQGARAMNLAVADLFRLEQEARFPFHHIHAVGSYGWEWMPERVAELGVELENCPSIDMRQYIYNMPTVMAAADIVISRAGASSCSEIAASGTPCILIPSPNVTDNHQEKNARAMEGRGAASVLLEKDCAAQALMDRIREMLADRAGYQAMRKAQQEMAVVDSAEQICGIMEDLIRAGKH